MPAIMATTALESTPPERNAPSGTSAMSRNLTDSRRRLMSSSAASRSVIRANGANGTSQYSHRRRGRHALPQGERAPGGSLNTFLNIVRGSGT